MSPEQIQKDTYLRTPEDEHSEALADKAAINGKWEASAPVTEQGGVATIPERAAMGSEIDSPGYVAAATDQIQKAEQQTKAVWDGFKKEQQAEDIQNDPNYPVQQGVLHGPHPTPSEEEKLTQDLDNVLKAKNIPEAATDKLVQENLESFNQVEATRKEAEQELARMATEGALNEEKPSEPQDPAPEAETPVIKPFYFKATEAKADGTATPQESAVPVAAEGPTADSESPEAPVVASVSAPLEAAPAPQEPVAPTAAEQPSAELQTPAVIEAPVAEAKPALQAPAAPTTVEQPTAVPVSPEASAATEPNVAEAAPAVAESGPALPEARLAVASSVEPQAPVAPAEQPVVAEAQQVPAPSEAVAPSVEKAPAMNGVSPEVLAAQKASAPSGEQEEAKEIEPSEGSPDAIAL
jgi:hypothetical protein